MMRIKNTFRTFVLPDTPAVPIDDANDLTLEIEDDQVYDDEVPAIEEVKVEACQPCAEEPIIVSDSSDAEEAHGSGIDRDSKSETEEKTSDVKQQQKPKAVHKSQVFKCTMENCSFTSIVEKYLAFHLERHKLYDNKKEMEKTCRMCKTFKSSKHWELSQHRMTCPGYEKLKKRCSHSDCTYVTFKLKYMNVHMEKYHSNTGTFVRNPHMKKDMLQGNNCKRKNENEEKAQEKKLKVDDDKQKEAQIESNKDTIKDDTAIIINDTIKADTIIADTIEADTIEADTIEADTIKDDTIKDDTIKDDTIKDDTTKNDAIKDGSVQEVIKDTLFEDKDDDTDEEALKIDESYEEEPVEIEQVKQELIEEAAPKEMKQTIEEQITNTINLLCDINKGQRKPEDSLQGTVSSRLVLENTEDIDLQMRQNIQEDNNSLLNLIEIKELL